jgi:UDPglucose 6-dehydrogenase
MRIGIAGYGNIGQYIGSVFGPSHEIVPYDPPRGIGTIASLDECDFVFICVPTPSLADGSCDTRAVEDVVSRVTPRQVLICHSTVAIGTTERLRERYGKRLVFVPEYAGESAEHPYRNIENQTFFFLGGDPADTEPVQALFETVFGHGCDYFHVEPRVAEMVKYMENAYLALKVTFCNEFFDLAQAFGVDYEQARLLWTRDFRIGTSHTHVTEERGYGGMCLPKDVAAVCATAREAGTPLELLETMQRVNDRVRRQSAAAEEPSGTIAIQGG